MVGGYRDSVGESLVHVALGAQFRVVGRTYLGASFMASAKGYSLDRIYLAPLPVMSVEAGPVDLSVHYVPRLRGITGDSAVFGFHVTIWPFGGRGEATTGLPDPDARMALEFGLEGGPTLTGLTGYVLSLRWTRNRNHAWRAGIRTDVGHDEWQNVEHWNGVVSESSGTVDRAGFGLQIQHLRLAPSARGTRFFVAVGAQFGYHTDGGAERWSPGLILGLGAEVDIIAGLSLLAEYTTTCFWEVVEEDLPQSRSQVDLQAGARVGVALWW